MPEVIVRKGEPVDRALKRLKNKLDSEGILEEVRRLRAFETPSQKQSPEGESQRQARPNEVSIQFLRQLQKLQRADSENRCNDVAVLTVQRANSSLIACTKPSISWRRASISTLSP